MAEPYAGFLEAENYGLDDHSQHEILRGLVRS
jgi:hypothetical protein